MSSPLFLLDTNIVLALIRGSGLAKFIDEKFRHQSEPVAPMVSSPLCETFKDSPIFCATLKIGKKRTGHAAGHCPGV